MTARRAGIVGGLVLVALLGAAAFLLLWPPLPNAASSTVLDRPPLRVWAPAGQLEIDHGELRPLRRRVTLWVESSQEELGPVVWRLHGAADGMEIPSIVPLRGILSGRATKSVADAEDGFPRRLFLEWQPGKARRSAERSTFFYRLVLRFPDLGEGGEPPRITLLGLRETLAQDRFTIDWGGCGAPEAVRGGETFLVLARLTNASPHPWTHRGPARVRLAYRWLDAGGARIGGEAAVTDLRRDVAPGSEIAQWLRVRAPDEPGRRELELDGRFEPFTWFSRRGAETCRVEVTVR